MHERRCISSIILCASSYVPDMHGNIWQQGIPSAAGLVAEILPHNSQT